MVRAGNVFSSIREIEILRDQETFVALRSGSDIDVVVSGEAF